MQRIGLIHLSDLQFGAKHRFGFPSNISDKLAHDIQRLAESESFFPLYLVLSGDISETSSKIEFEDAVKSIQSIATQLAIDSRNILVVPGNHDVNWELAKSGKLIGHNSIKFQLFNEFVRRLGATTVLNEERYELVPDHQHGLSFLLINSAENEDDEIHVGHVDIKKMLAGFEQKHYQSQRFPTYTKIAIMHHSIYGTGSEQIDNAKDVEAVLIKNNFHILLNGHCHVYETMEKIFDGDRLIVNTCGSSGVNKSQRVDGIGNHYSTIVIDPARRECEIYYRIFNPQARTRMGIGGWISDNTYDRNPSVHSLPHISEIHLAQDDQIENPKLYTKFNLKSNPFTCLNAEKISLELLVSLFVDSGDRLNAATRLIGDSIIRGKRGSGKTMLLRYLNIFGTQQFFKTHNERMIAEVFPVFINLSTIHRSDIDGSTVMQLFQVADKLIYNEIIANLESKSDVLKSPQFKLSIHNLKQYVKNNAKDKPLIEVVGKGLREYFGTYFTHVLLLIDEIAPIFPPVFFEQPNDGFFKWLNTIRNAGPFFIRVAIYPNTVADRLNEERFGSIVDLEYDVKNESDYEDYRTYCKSLADRYLQSASVNVSKPVKLSDILEITDDSNDALEQIVYASDGSSRRFVALLDKLLMLGIREDRESAARMDKDVVFELIKEYSNNLFKSYQTSDQQLALLISKACKKQGTFRFIFPNMGATLNSLFAGREETNILKLVEVGSGRRGHTFEFTYPFCLLEEIPTHTLKKTRTICQSRDSKSGEWISKTTKIQNAELDEVNQVVKKTGVVSEKCDELILVKGEDGNDYYCNDYFDSIEVGNEITFQNTGDIAFDIERIGA